MSVEDIAKIDNGSVNPEDWSRSLLLVAYREKEKQNKALMELVGDITRCIEYCTEEANMSYLHYWREKLKEIGGE